MPPALSVAFGASFLPEEASCLRKSIPYFTGRLPFQKTLFPGEGFTFKCINREDRVQALPGGARWDAPTVGKNEAHLRCMKNEAGLRPMKRGFAARRVNGEHFALCSSCQGSL